MSKTKKVLLMCTAYVLVAALAIGGTIAYLTSTDSDVNVMTLGNVSIVQHEYQRVQNADDTYTTDTIDERTSYVLEVFEQGKALLPIVGDPSTGAAGWDTTTVRMSQVDSYGGMQVFAGKNAVDKFVTVENTGKTDAYIRTIVAIEVGSTDGSLIGSSYHSNWSKNAVGKINVDGNNYYVFEYVYKGASDNSRHVGGILPAGETSYPNLSQVYLKSVATNEDMNAIDGNGNGTLDILVLSQAVQTAGFADAKTALDTAFGTPAENAAEWFAETEIPTLPIIPTIKVTTPKELRTALDDPDLAPGTVIDGEGVTIILENNEHYLIPGGITLKNITFNSKSRGGEYMIMTSGVGDTITFENCTIKREEMGMVIIGAENAQGPNMVFNGCTFNGPIAPNFVEKADGNAQFNSCTFGLGTAMMKQGWVNAMGGTHTFTSCTFNYAGGSTSGSNQYVKWNAVNSYSERYSTAVVLDSCSFTNCGTQRYGSNSTLTIK